MSKLLFLLFMTVALMVGSAAAVEIPIPVPNASFEESTITDGSWEYVNYSGVPWICSSLAESGAWTARNYVQGYGYPQVGHDSPTYTEFNGLEVYQTLTDTYEEGVEYALSAWCATHLGYTGNMSVYFTDGVDFDPAAALYNSGEQVVPTSPDNGPLSHIWYQYVFTYTATAADAGKNIGIMFNGGGSTNFDDVELNIVLSELAKNPYPPDGAPPPLVLVDTDLSWEAPKAYTADYYDLWFGDPNTNPWNPNPLGWTLFLDQQNQTTWDPPAGPGSGDLAYGTTYYWRVDTYDPNDGNQFLHIGPIWSFTTIPPEPLILAQPENQTVEVTATATFTIEQYNGDTYEWFQSVDANNLSPEDDTFVDSGTCSGSTVTLVLDDVQLVDEGYYYCVLTNDDGDTLSDTALLATQKLLGWWKMDEALGTTASDSSIYGNDGTLIGGFKFNNAAVPGVSGNALEFDGSDDYVDCGSGAELRPTASLTVSAWVKPDRFAYYEGIVANVHDTGSTESGYLLMTNDSDTFGAGVCGDDGGLGYINDGPYSTGQWYYVVLTNDGSTSRLYIDGLETASVAESTPIDYDPISAFEIGRYSDDDEEHYFMGAIDEVQVYNYALTSDEIIFAFGKPVITEQPQNLIVSAGATITLTVSAVADPAEMQYEWFKDSVSLVPDAGKYSGTDSNTLTIIDFQSTEEGDYYCEVTNTKGMATSDTASLLLAQLVSHWTFNTGDLLTDTVGSNDGAAFGPSGPTYATGKIGDQAISLDGTEPNNVVVVPYAFGLNTGQLTVSLWAKVAGGSGEWRTPLGSRSESSVDTRGYNLYASSSDTWQFWTGNSGGGWYSTGNAPVVEDEWTFLAATYNSATLVKQLYVNGALNAETTLDAAVPLNVSPNALQIGGNGNSASVTAYIFNGSIDDVKVYSYVLDKYQIAAEYTDVDGGWVCTDPPSYDKNGDCIVGLDDFAALAAKWMDCNIYPPEECP